ncbi:MAG: hypothetical protein R3D28_21840 [Geminicoccaceae bacterium]
MPQRAAASEPAEIDEQTQGFDSEPGPSTNEPERPVQQLQASGRRFAEGTKATFADRTRALDSTPGIG